MPDNPVFLKLQWAEKRLRELDGILAAYSAQPQPIVIELDANENFLLYRLKHDPVIQPDIPLLAGDILQGLRSASANCIGPSLGVLGVAEDSAASG